MLPSFFRKTIIIDGWNEPWRSPTREEALETVFSYAEKLNLECSAVSSSVVEICGCEYDVVPVRVFRASYSVKLIRR